MPDAMELTSLRLDGGPKSLISFAPRN